MKESFVEWGVAAASLPGQSLSGDRHVVCPYPNGILLGVVDGLGHGQEAAQAADLAVTTVTKYAQESVIALFKHCHAQLRETRGVVMSLALISASDGAMTWMGVGNVEGIVVRAATAAGPRREPLLLRNGVVGIQLPALYASIIPILRGDTVIFATDGIRKTFIDSLNMSEGPQQAADRILAQHHTATDDALVLVARCKG